MRPSLYIHIPFCQAKCNYCSFNSYEGLDGLHERYVKALAVECHRLGSEGLTGPLQSVFLGGGTPTVLSSEQLRKIIANLYESFEIEQDAEISIEANPGTVNREKLEVLRAGGWNRLSIGVQSLSDVELGEIGRIHTAEEAKQAIRAAQKAGFSNLSIDLMYGLPEQTAESWYTSLSTALAMDVQHLSLYELTVERATPLQSMLTAGRMQLPEEEVLAEMDAITADLTKRNGFIQYEISNYARKGFQCRHNINYWQNGEYYAVGAGAVSYFEGRRMKNVASPLQYCRLLESGKSVVVDAECLEREASFRESVIMGLRMNRGVSLERLQRRYGIGLDHVYGTTVEKLVNRDLLKFEKDHLCLTEQGRVFANQVMAELV